MAKKDYTWLVIAAVALLVVASSSSSGKGYEPDSRYQDARGRWWIVQQGTGGTVGKPETWKNTWHAYIQGTSPADSLGPFATKAMVIEAIKAFTLTGADKVPG